MIKNVMVKTRAVCALAGSAVMIAGGLVASFAQVQGTSSSQTPYVLSSYMYSVGKNTLMPAISQVS